MAARLIIPRIAARASKQFATPTFVRAFHPSIIRRVDEHTSELPGVNHIPGSTTSPGSPEVTPKPVTQIPVVSYQDGKRVTEQIAVTKQEGPVNPAGIDIEHKAMALTQNVIEQLTPTMKKFTLEGKTAIVTG